MPWLILSPWRLVFLGVGLGNDLFDVFFRNTKVGGKRGFEFVGNGQLLLV